MVDTHEGSVLYVCTKFETDSFIRSKVIIKVSKISKLGHVTMSHARFDPETLNLCRNSSSVKFYTSSLNRSWMKAMSMDHFNGKIGNAHAPCHVTGW